METLSPKLAQYDTERLHKQQQKTFIVFRQNFLDPDHSTNIYKYVCDVARRLFLSMHELFYPDMSRQHCSNFPCESKKKNDFSWIYYKPCTSCSFILHHTVQSCLIVWPLITFNVWVGNKAGHIAKKKKEKKKINLHMFINIYIQVLQMFHSARY